MSIIIEDFRQEIEALALQIRAGFLAPTFENKRVIMGKLNIQADFRVDNVDRWLDLARNLSPEGIELRPSQNSIPMLKFKPAT